MHTTRNTLPEATRRTICELLAPRLADAVDLLTQAKQAHWTVRGPNFQGLHEVFDGVAEQAQEWADLLAERIVQLGGTPVGTVRSVAAATTLPEYPLAVVSWDGHVSAVAGVLADFGGKIRAAIDRASSAGDQVTADLCTEICREVDKQLWLVEAHDAKIK